MFPCFTGGPKVLSLRVLTFDERRRWVEVFKAHAEEPLSRSYRL